MVVGAAVCPHPPLLLRELCGQHDAVPELRRAARDAVDALLAAAPDTVVVVGGGDTARDWDGRLRFDVTRLGTAQAHPRPGSGSDLPLSLGVGSRLLDEAGWDGPRELLALAWETADDDLEKAASALRARADRVGLLVMADGSARRGPTAPGYVDDRAPGFDQRLGSALLDGDAAGLRAMDTSLAAELMVLGRAPFRLLGHAVPRIASAKVLHDEAPLGVGYVVAFWEPAAD